MSKRSQKWLVLALVATGTFMSTLDSSIVAVALPTLTAVFKTKVSTSQWFVLAYTFVVTVLLLTFGKLGDLIGRRRLYTWGVMVFTAGSLVCSLSVSAMMLIVARGLQAVGASVIMSSGPALVTAAFPDEERGKSMGFIGSAVALGLLAGPLAGGLIVQYLSWHWMFFINIPIGLALAALMATRVTGLNECSGGRLDVPGAAFMAFALSALIAGLSLGERLGWLTPVPIACLLGAVVLGVAFVALERRTGEPVLNPRLFRHRDLAIGGVTGWANYTAVFPIYVFLPFFLANTLGYEPRKVGLMLAFGPLTLALVAPIAGSLSDRIGARILTCAGLLTASAGLLCLRTVHPGSSMFDIAWRLVLTSLGSAIFVSPNSSSVMGSVPKEELGIAAGVIALVRNLGMVCGIALAGSIISTVAGDENSEAFLQGLRAALLASSVIAFGAALVSTMRVRPKGQSGAVTGLGRTNGRPAESFDSERRRREMASSDSEPS